MVELTESALLESSAPNVDTLRKLFKNGVRVALDDFGTGYSSLSYLRRFPFDRIKIDRSFIADLETKDDCRAIIRAEASLGSDLGIDTTAEGVETESQLKTLRAEGLTEVQGYLFSPPVPRDEIVEVLAKAKAAVSAAGMSSTASSPTLTTARTRRLVSRKYGARISLTSADRPAR